MSTLPNPTDNHQDGESMSVQTCPRCRGPIEIVIQGGTEIKLAAMSRATRERDIEICAPCGSDEAMRANAIGYIIPVAEWPVNDPHFYHQPVQDAINAFTAENGRGL